jgi:hypothetical protein
MELSSRETDLSFDHLRAELTRIDALIQREIRRWQLAGQDPTDSFRGLYISDAEAQALAAQSFGGNWGRTVKLPSQEAESFAKVEAEAVEQIQTITEAARKQKYLTRLEHLTRAFNLDQFDLDTFLICLAPTLDLRYERLYAYLQNDATRKRPSVDLVLSLLSDTTSDRLLKQLRFSDEAILFKYKLLERGSETGAFMLPLLSQSLAPDPSVVAWLLGEYRPHASLDPHAMLIWPDFDEADQVVNIEDLLNLKQIFEANFNPVLAFYGPDQVGQDAAATYLAAHLGRPLLKVDLARIVETQVPAEQAFRLGFRDAHLTMAIPYLTGWDAYLVESSLSPDLLSELCVYPGLVILAGEKIWHPKGIDRKRTMLWLEFPRPVYHHRQVLWQHFLGEAASNVAEDLPTLAGQFVLTTGQIRDAVASARDMAAHRGEGVQAQDLFAAARAHSSLRLSHLARKINPRYIWEDIVLPTEQIDILHEIVNTVRGRPKVLEEWGVGQKLASSSAVTVLFAGPPGTGKTMAAEVLANELQLDLYKIDLSSVVSKYIGETEKNLEKIFNEAQNSNAILFFDEADAIFGKRSEVKDARDRYANIEVSYLLQRMETYDGVTILATNLRSNLDEAFTRRLHFIIDIPFPDEEYRLRIWETLFPPDVPRDPDLDLALMARRFKLAGGNIRNIIVSAAYLAAADGDVVTMDHLFLGVRREMQKMGRLVSHIDTSLEKPGPKTDLQKSKLSRRKRS